MNRILLLPPSAQMTVAALSMASMAAVAHLLRAEVPWPVLAFWRILFTFVVVAAMARVMSVPLVLRGPPVMWLRSVAGALGLLCTFYAITHMPITDALAIQHTNPLWVAVLLGAYYRRAPGPLTWLSIILGIAGVMLIERPSFDARGFAMMVALLGAWCMATATMSLRFLGGYPAVVVVAHYCGLSVLVAAAAWAVTLGLGGGSGSINGSAAGWIALMGLFGTIAQILMTQAMGRGDTQLMALIALSTIGFAAVYDYVFWDVRIQVTGVVGIGCIVASVAVCSMRPSEFPVVGRAAAERT